MRTLSLIAAAALLSACAGTGTPPRREPDPERARAALATLIVHNQTSERLAVLYRSAVSGSGGAVGVGHVDAGAAAELAPVPAGEPLILIARTDAGTELVLPPVTLEIDGTWTWLIPRGSRFVRQRGAG